jgi:hypothetical protein
VRRQILTKRAAKLYATSEAFPRSWRASVRWELHCIAETPETLQAILDTYDPVRRPRSSATRRSTCARLIATTTLRTIGLGSRA